MTTTYTAQNPIYTRMPQLLISNGLKKRDKKTKGILRFFFLYLPLIFVVLLSLYHLCLKKSVIEKKSVERYNFDEFLEKWEGSYGTFIRDFFFNELYKYLILQDNINSNLNVHNTGLPPPPKPTKEQCSDIPNELKFDCSPKEKATEEACSNRGCCFFQSMSEFPSCFFPKLYRSYKYANITKSDNGVTAYLEGQFKSPYPKDIVSLKLDFVYLTDEILYINVTDTQNSRFSFPFPEEPIKKSRPLNPKYDVQIDEKKIGFKIIRKSNNRVIFNSEDIGGFIYSDQFIQISSILPSKYIYGLGERRNDFLLDLNWKTFSLFNHDTAPRDNVNLYGFHPFYMSLEGDGSSHGVFIKNLYPMDVVLQPGPAITFRILGGNLKMAIFLGPSPVEVVEQYTSIIGRPFLPPYWSLGFHLCRYGYRDLDHLFRVWNRTRAAGIPFDTQWTDIDYLENHNDFTINQTYFKKLPEFVQLVHEAGMHYVIIIEPGISGGETPGTYRPFDDGMKDNIFIMDSTGKKPFMGKVWNLVTTVFPDFSHPKVLQYWLTQIKNFHNILKFDGAWADMNEPSNFWNGGKDGCPVNELDNPPYIPLIDGNSMKQGTVCMSAIQYFGKHYDLHNIYGTLETIVTSFVMSYIRGSRPFVISRSSAPGLGKYGGHWTGDIFSNWNDMRHSIGDMISFSMFGIPFVGSDICGFNFNTTPALCQRWSQLGAFYPFSRNHNEDDAIDQDPVAMGDEVVNSTRKALLARYSLLPYLYTLLWEANMKGTPVIQALFMQFPLETETYKINTQFMWGNSILFAPVLKEGVTTLKAYLPKDVWFDLHNSKRIESNGEYFSVNAPLDIIPMFHRGGTIIPLQIPDTTTTVSRKNPFYLFVALNNSMEAFGQLYWDDGESIGADFNLIQWNSLNGEFNSKVISWNYAVKMPLTSLFIYSVPSVTRVKIGSDIIPFKYNKDTKTLSIFFEEDPIDLGEDFKISWS